MTHQKNLEKMQVIDTMLEGHYYSEVHRINVLTALRTILDTLEKETLERAALAICPHQGMQKVVHRFCCEHAQEIRNLGRGE